MKKMKTKFFTMLIAIFVIGGTMNIFAADKTTLTTAVSGDTAKGGEITVKVDMADNANLGGVEIELTYDSTKLQYVSGALNDEFKDSAVANAVIDSGESVKLTLSFNDPSNYNGAIAEIKFKVLAESGDKVSLGLNAVLVDIDYNEMTVEAKPAEFTVKIPMTAIAIEGEADRTILKGETIALTAKISPENTTETNKTIKWTSSDEKVAKVDANGKVTAVGGGKAVITATTEIGSLTAKANVTVNVKLTGIDVKADTDSVEMGKTLQLTAVKVPADSTDSLGEIKWKSSDENVAKVDAKGLVTAVKAGEVKISATAAGYTKEIIIKVTEPKKADNTTVVPAAEPTTTAPKKDAMADGDSKTGDTANTAAAAMLFVCAAIGGMFVMNRRNITE